MVAFEQGDFATSHTTLWSHGERIDNPTAAQIAETMFAPPAYVPCPAPACDHGLVTRTTAPRRRTDGSLVGRKLCRACGGTGVVPNDMRAR